MSPQDSGVANPSESPRVYMYRSVLLVVPWGDSAESTRDRTHSTVLGTLLVRAIPGEKNTTRGLKTAASKSRFSVLAAPRWPVARVSGAPGADGRAAARTRGGERAGSKGAAATRQPQ